MHLSALFAATALAGLAAADNWNKHPPPQPHFTCKPRHEQRYKGDWERNRCLTLDEVKCIDAQWDALFNGINDGGAAARQVLAPNFKYFSQSESWTTPGNRYYGVNATGDPYPFDYPPLYNRETLIKAYSGLMLNTSYVSGPYVVSCDSYAAYWRGNLQPSGVHGPTNGIDMIFLHPGTYDIEAAFTEYNTLAYVADPVAGL